MTYYLDNLNTQQRQAVEATEGYVRVIAGAGTGKTKTLTGRFLYLVDELGLDPASILCVTFTNKAANEMKSRVRRVIGDADLRYISTFHGFCVNVLKEECHAIQYPSRFVIIDREDMKEMLHHILIDLSLDPKDFKIPELLDYICQCKQDLTYLDQLFSLDLELLQQSMEQSLEVKDLIFYRYLYEQRKSYALDFDDLINSVLYIFRHNPDITKRWQQQLEYIMVDEFQDIDGAQYELVSILSQGHHNLFIVGDPDQTIYTWRGAKVEYILNFESCLEKATTIYLNTNYRSNPSILKVSNSLIEKNQQRLDKALVPIKNGETPVLYFHGRDMQEEVDWIVGEIQALVEKGVSLKQIAILYRSHFLSRAFEETLTKQQLPYTLYNGVEFYKRKEIKDLIAYLRLIVYEDDLSFLRIVNVPKRNIGDKRIQLVRRYAQSHNCSLYQALKANLEAPLIQKSEAASFVELIEQMRVQLSTESLSNLFTQLLDQSGYEALLRTNGDQDRLDNLSELKQSIYLYEKEAGETTTLEDYLQRIALFTDLEREEKLDSLKMMTIHTAKGLEFPYVFICGLNEGTFPTRRATTLDKMEEERRLAYVAYTRAEEQLYLSGSNGMNYDGTPRYPSRFVFEVEAELLTPVKGLDPLLMEEARLFITYSTEELALNNSEFQVGDSVFHKVLGEGIIQEVKSEKQQCVVMFTALETTRTLRFKVLEKRH